MKSSLTTLIFHPCLFLLHHLSLIIRNREITKKKKLVSEDRNPQRTNPNHKDKKQTREIKPRRWQWRVAIEPRRWRLQVTTTGLVDVSLWIFGWVSWFLLLMVLSGSLGFLIVNVECCCALLDVNKRQREVGEWKIVMFLSGFSGFCWVRELCWVQTRFVQLLS